MPTKEKYHKRKSEGRCTSCGKSNHGPYTKCSDCSAQGIRAAVLQKYGARCVACGEDDPNVLTLDHVYDDGAQERRLISSKKLYYVEAKSPVVRADLQILCANCQLRKVRRGPNHEGWLLTKCPGCGRLVYNGHH